MRIASVSSLGAARPVLSSHTVTGVAQGESPMIPATSEPPIPLRLSASHASLSVGVIWFSLSFVFV
jgi:hypothetical protein